MSETVQIEARKRRTSAQVRALRAYRIAEHEEDRYLGSVFVTPRGSEEKRKACEAAYESCKRLGLGVEAGL